MTTEPTTVEVPAGKWAALVDEGEAIITVPAKVSDGEMNGIIQIVEILKRLNEEQRSRTVKYLYDRFAFGDLSIPDPGPVPPGYHTTIPPRKL